MKRIMLTAIVMLAFAFYPTASQAVISSLTVTSATLSKSTGAASVTGTIVCTAGDLFIPFTQILQVSGRNNGIVHGNQSPAFCSGGVDTWVALTVDIFGSIKNGNALVLGQALDITDFTFVQQVFHQPIKPAP
jgi:hypothetical protein